MHMYIYFFLFGELLSTLSGINIESRKGLSANHIQVLAIYIFRYWAWYNCICFISKILIELIINCCFFSHFFYRERDPGRVNSENHSKETEPMTFRCINWIEQSRENTLFGISLKLKKELSQIRSSSIFLCFLFQYC